MTDQPTFGDQVVMVTLASSDLVGIEVAKAQGAATDALSSALRAENAAQATTASGVAARAAIAADLVSARGAIVDEKASALATLAFPVQQAVAAAQSASFPAMAIALIGGLTFPPAMSAVAADGWEANVAAPVDLSMTQVSVARQGFDVSGSPTIVIDKMMLTKRVRQVYPNQANLTPNNVSLSDYIYATDAVLGVPILSTEVSPKPVAAWVMPSRLLVGNSVHWELIAFHRDGRAGRQVVCVRVRGVNVADPSKITPWQTVSTTAISSLCEDAQPVEAYMGDLDVTGLPEGLFRLEGEVYPFIGSTASVLRSEDQTDPREFSRRYFTKDVARAAAPPLAYFSPTGNNATGVCSTSAATAKANPFADLQGAITGALAATAVSGGKSDGVHIRCMAGNNIWGAFNTALNRRQDSAAIIIERDPDSPRASCVLQQSGGVGLKIGYATSSTTTLTSPLTECAIIIRDLTYQRTAAGQISSGGALVPLDVTMWNVVWDNGNVVGAWNSGGAIRLFGFTITNANSFFGYSPAMAQRIHRGVVATVSTGGIEDWVHLGCRLSGKSGGSFRDRTKGLIAYNNWYVSPGASGSAIEVAAANAGETVSGSIIVQNVFEVTGSSTTIRALSVSADGANGNTHHVVIQNNTFTGYGLVGRANILYDESTGTNRRTHRLLRMTGNIFTQLNVKGDVFVATNQGAPAEAPYRTGYFATLHGVGCQGNWSMFAVQAVSSEAQAYPGPGSNIGTSTSVRNDPLFVNYQGTGGSGGVATAGSPGSDLRLQAGSAARGIVSVPVLGFDLAGVARGLGVQAAGSYV